MLTDCQFFHSPGGCQKYKCMKKRLANSSNSNSNNNNSSTAQTGNNGQTTETTTTNTEDNTADDDEFNPEKNCAFRHCQASLKSKDVCIKWMKFKTCNNVSCPKRHLPQLPNYLRRIPSDLTQLCRKGDDCMNPVCCFKHPTRWINGLRYKEDPSDIPIKTAKTKSLA